jgi:hypothetical protein
MHSFFYIGTIKLVLQNIKFKLTDDLGDIDSATLKECFVDKNKNNFYDVIDFICSYDNIFPESISYYIIGKVNDPIIVNINNKTTTVLVYLNLYWRHTLNDYPLINLYNLTTSNNFPYSLLRVYEMIDGKYQISLNLSDGYLSYPDNKDNLFDYYKKIFYNNWDYYFNKKIKIVENETKKSIVFICEIYNYKPTHNYHSKLNIYGKNLFFKQAKL